MTSVTANALTEQLGVPVQIDRIGLRWLNRLVLEGVSLDDQSGKTLFEANHISAGFNPLPFLQGKYVFTTVRLFGFTLNLSKNDPDDKLNLQFVIDAFSKQDTTANPLNLDLRLNSVMLRKGHIRYNVFSEQTTPGKFNPKHIDIDNISANISLKTFSPDSVNTQIKRLSFDEASGFHLEKMSMDIIGNRDSASIDNFEIRLPQSRLSLNRAIIHISEVNSLTTFLNEAQMELNIAPSQICLKDLSSFIPAFSSFNDTIQISAEASGYVNNFELKQLQVSQRDILQFTGQMEMRGITRPEETYIFGRVNQMYITPEGMNNLANNFNKERVTLPAYISRLGNIHFVGEISGFFDNLVAYGRLSTAIGSLQTDIIFGSNKERNIAAYIKGNAFTPGIQINRLFEQNNPYGNVRFNLTLDAHRPVNGDFISNIRGTIEEIDYKGYTYENILLAGNFKKNGFDGTIEINDPNGELRGDGMFTHDGQNSVFNFTMDVRNFKPDKLNLIERFDSPEISFKLNADFTGDNIDNLAGTIHLDSFLFRTAPSDFFLEKLDIDASGRLEDRKLTIHSDILNGEVVGAYSFNTIYSSFLNTFEGYLPALVGLKQQQEKVKENNFSILLTIENTEQLSKAFKLPVSIINQGRVAGHYNNRYNKFRLEAWFPKFAVGNSTFESGYVSCENPNQKVDLHVKAIQYNQKGLRNYIDLKADAAEDNINTLISWANNKEQLFKADISASTSFIEEEKEDGKAALRTEISIHNSPFYISDSLWTMNPASITIQNGKINIDNFEITHDAQYIHLDGAVSHEVNDTLILDLKQIELSYIFDVLNIPVLQFGGEATGTFIINDLYDSRMLHTDLEVKDFSFNQTNLGLLNLYSEWDEMQKGILMLGSIYKNDSTWTDVNGYIFPIKPNEGLSLYFDANDIDVSFLQPFLANVGQNLQGRGFGNVHLFGPFNEITTEGQVFVQDGGLGIEFLNTYYTFSDSIYMEPDKIQIRNATIYDKFGNSGKTDVTFNHKFFKDYDFTVDIQATNMLMYDQPERNSPMIYGTVFGSGSGTISGNENLINFDVNVRNAPKTNVGFNFMTSSASSEYNFITFINKDNPSSEPSINGDSIRIRPAMPESSAEIRMNFQVEVTPDANIELIMDPNAGDRIRGNASGSLQVQYGTKSDLRMFGGMNIVQGNYNFSLQQLIYRDFKIREGSSIVFQGDPYNAVMDIDAIYSLTANIKDLDESLTYESDRQNIPVNCVLLIEGMLRNPTISFDIELPSSNDEIERQVRTFIDTDIPRQIVYLLVLNKFYTPDYSTSKSNSNDFSAVASSALSTQLSNILNTITDKVQIGTNIRAYQDGIENNTEVEMLLSSQLLDNRLIFNGNFGYRNSLAMQKSVFVGEFDLEYLLTPSGEIRLKAYNHANDMYQYLKQSLFTQGVGIMFKKDFTQISEIFRRRKKALLLLPEKEEIKEEEKIME